VLAFSDASHTRTYGKTGFLSRFQILMESPNSLYHVIDWSSHKQARVAFYSIGSEILAAAYAADRGYALTSAVTDLARASPPVHFEQTVDSKGLFDILTTLYESKRDFRLRPTVARLRDSFGAAEIQILRWIPGSSNLSDPLTKRSSSPSVQLNNVCQSGLLSQNFLDDGVIVDSRNWC
jgi:hypothetical protein